MLSSVMLVSVLSYKIDLTNLLEQSYWMDLHPNVLALPA